MLKEKSLGIVHPIVQPRPPGWMEHHTLPFGLVHLGRQNERKTDEGCPISGDSPRNIEFFSCFRIRILHSWEYGGKVSRRECSAYLSQRVSDARNRGRNLREDMNQNDEYPDTTTYPSWGCYAR